MSRIDAVLKQISDLTDDERVVLMDRLLQEDETADAQWQEHCRRVVAQRRQALAEGRSRLVSEEELRAHLVERFPGP